MLHFSRLLLYSAEADRTVSGEQPLSFRLSVCKGVCVSVWSGEATVERQNTIEQEVSDMMEWRRLLRLLDGPTPTLPALY